MKLVTIPGNWYDLDPAYLPGKCNIGGRGRAIRLHRSRPYRTIGNPRIDDSRGLFWAVRLVLVLPIYVGFLAALEGSMSFCVLHAARGTYDFHEPRGFASNQSRTLKQVGSEEWKRIDRRKALRMHVEAAAGAVLLAILLALA